MRRAPASHDGVVTLPGLGAVPAWISKLPDQHLQVALRMRAPLEVDRLLGAEVGVQFAGPLGLFRGQGVVDATGPGEETFAVALPPETKFVQRRADVRVSASVPVTLRADESEDWLEGVTRDVSGSGLLFAGRCDLAVGAIADLRLTTGSDQPPIEGRARVMRIADDGCRGMAFTELDAGQRQRLVRFVFECERAALQQGRR